MDIKARRLRWTKKNVRSEKSGYQRKGKAENRMGGICRGKTKKDIKRLAVERKEFRKWT